MACVLAVPAMALGMDKKWLQASTVKRLQLSKQEFSVPAVGLFFGAVECRQRAKVAPEQVAGDTVCYQL